MVMAIITLLIKLKSKLLKAANCALAKLLDYFNPSQISVGVREDCEAASYACNR